MWIMFKVIHVMAILLAVGASLGPEILMYRIARSNSVQAIRAGFGLATPLLRAAPALYMLGLIMGLGAVYSGGWSFGAPWLVLSYALFALMIFLNLRFRNPWLKRVIAAARASSDEPSEALQVALRDPRGQIHMWVAPFAILVQAFLMVIKPFS